MFASVTTTGAIAAATPFAAQVTAPALVVVGAGVAIGLTGWVIRKMRKAAR